MFEQVRHFKCLLFPKPLQRLQNLLHRFLVTFLKQMSHKIELKGTQPLYHHPLSDGLLDLGRHDDSILIYLTRFKYRLGRCIRSVNEQDTLYFSLIHQSVPLYFWVESTMAC